MKYLLLLVFSLMPIANAESWIKLYVPKGSIDHIDRDSIKKIGDFAYYTMKDDDSDDGYSIIKFKHDCKYSARRVLTSDYYDKETNKLLHTNIPATDEMFQYPRSTVMIRVEDMVCR